jgi:uncharacterized membrane protein
MIKEIRLIISALFGIVGCALSYIIFKAPLFCLIIAWCIFALFFIFSIIYDFAKHNSDATKSIAIRDDMNRTISDTLIIIASLSSLIGVFCLSSIHTNGVNEVMQLVVCLFCIVLSWIMLQLIFTLKYTALYYKMPEGGVSFNCSEKPSFSDFAYLAFTIGMTYQVSDTNLQSSDMRKLALRHALLSFVFGTSIIATSINLTVNL